jgi:hypothetical protein
VTLGKLLVLLGGLLLLAGVLLLVVERLGVRPGELPGDLVFRGEGWVVAIPITTSIVLSILLTLVLALIQSLRN